MTHILTQNKPAENSRQGKQEHAQKTWQKMKKFTLAAAFAVMTMPICACAKEMVHADENAKGKALLIIDMQDEFLNRLNEERTDSLVNKINRIKAAADSGHAEVRIIEYMDTGPSIIKGEHNLAKPYDDAFEQTPLVYDLIEKGIGKIIICGVNASQCVLKTAESAKEYGFEIATAPGLTEDPDTAGLRTSMEWFMQNGEVMTEEQIREHLKNPNKKEK